jgi:SAM-dependent methyltransferase
LSFDVNTLVEFYDSPVGGVVGRILAAKLAAQWDGCRGLCVASLGFGAPLLQRVGGDAARRLLLMPAEQGVAPWPSSERNAVALVDASMIPLPDGAVDRLLVIHSLETTEEPGALLEEAARVLAPSGRGAIVAPSRRGLWARGDGTPFGVGQPFSRAQLRELIGAASLTPIAWEEALYAPPLLTRWLVPYAQALEAVGGALGWPFAGVHFVGVTKQVTRLIPARRVDRRRALGLKARLAVGARGPAAEPA